MSDSQQLVRGIDLERELMRFSTRQIRKRIHATKQIDVGSEGLVGAPEGAYATEITVGGLAPRDYWYAPGAFGTSVPVEPQAWGVNPLPAG
jgi:hypothetical protein